MILIAGGAILGYCAIGRPVMQSAPATVMKMAMTHAKTGRSMKNLDIGKRFVTGRDQCAGAARATPADGGAWTGTGLTGAPGRTRWRLLTMTWSPGFRPAVTSH